MSALPIQGASERVLSHDDFEHLTLFKWEALRRLADLAGLTTVVAMLIDTPERLQRVAIQDFVNRELAELRREASTPAVVTGSNVIKLDVSSYIGEGPKRLALNRWLCEVHIAVQARQLSMEFTRTHFLLSKLTGTAKECALGKLVANSGCFPDMQALTDDLRLALEPPQDKHHHRSAFFEPPQDKHHHRSAFFALRQGSKIHSTRATSGIVYIRLPYRHGDTSLCVRDRDECWVSAFLLKAKISSHEEAFSIALREDYSVLASQVGHSLPLRAAQEPAPIEIDAIGPAAGHRRASSHSSRKPATAKNLVWSSSAVVSLVIAQPSAARLHH